MCHVGQEVSRNPIVSSTNGHVLRGKHVLRNYLQNKVLCAIASVFF